MMKLLVQNGANIDVTNIYNDTPFEITDQENRQDIAFYLLQKKREGKNIIPKENFSIKEPCIICCSYALKRQTNPKCPSCRASVQDYSKVFFQSPL